MSPNVQGGRGSGALTGCVVFCAPASLLFCRSKCLRRWTCAPRSSWDWNRLIQVTFSQHICELLCIPIRRHKIPCQPGNPLRSLHLQACPPARSPNHHHALWSNTDKRRTLFEPLRTGDEAVSPSTHFHEEERTKPWAIPIAYLESGCMITLSPCAHGHVSSIVYAVWMRCVYRQQEPAKLRLTPTSPQCCWSTWSLL